MTIVIRHEEDKKYGEPCTIEVNGLSTVLISDLETQDEVLLTIEIPNAWEILYRGGSNHNVGQLVLRRII